MDEQIKISEVSWKCWPDNRCRLWRDQDMLNGPYSSSLGTQQVLMRELQTHTHVHTLTHTPTSTHTHMHTRTYARAPTHTHTHTLICCPDLSLQWRLLWAIFAVLLWSTKANWESRNGFLCHCHYIGFNSGKQTDKTKSLSKQKENILVFYIKQIPVHSWPDLNQNKWT